jgi:head-tail adaptor
MASIRNLSGQELFQGDEFTSAAQVRIRMRWTGDNTQVGHRVAFGPHTYVVQICDNVLLRNRVLQLTCLEIDGSS